MNENPLARKADNLAIASLALVWLPLVAVILGHMSLSAYKKSNTSYFRPVALTGTIIGWISLAGIILYIVAMIFLVTVVGLAGLTEAVSSY